MSTTIVPSSSSSPSSDDIIPSFNNFSSRFKARRSLRSLVSHLEAKSINISQPNPLDSNNNAASTSASSSASTTTINSNDHSQAPPPPPALSNVIQQDLTFLKKAVEEASEYVGRVKEQIIQACDKFEELKTNGSNERELDELKKTVLKLKSHVVSKLKIHADKKSATSSSSSSNLVDNVNNKAARDRLVQQNLDTDRHIEHTPAFEQLKVSFLGLPFQLKVCLLCFFTFPEKATIKKRSMIYWWIGEGILPQILMDQKPEEGITQVKTSEDLGNEIFDKLIAKGFVEPVCSKCSFPDKHTINKRSVIYWWIGAPPPPPLMHRKTEEEDEEIEEEKTAEDFGNESFDKLTAAKGFIKPVCTKCSLFVDSCRMHPFVRSVLSILFERAGFSLDELRCWLNVGDSVIDDGPELFSDRKYIKILYLGRWQSLATHHIEVTDTKIFDGLKNMKHLSLLSLRGISMITELPEFISQLINLKIMDLRACHNLEAVPDGIGLLKSLTHLDMSECYFLDHMPKGLASLSELQVLKGFLVGDSKDKRSCTLDDLAKLPKLRKLNVYTSVKDFPTEKQLRALQQFKVLRKLTISWGGCSLLDGATDAVKQVKDAVESTEPTTAAAAAAQPRASLTRESSIVVPFQLKKLEKLDLQCFPPGRSTLSWLRPANLMHLKKLYIRGGKFSDLGQFSKLDQHEEVDAANKKEDQWTVEILRLKYLNELQMDWRELRRLFPQLICLEVVECPMLNCFPCEKSGAWMNRTNKNKLQ